MESSLILKFFSATDHKSDKSVSSMISPTLEFRRKGQGAAGQGQGHGKVTSPRPGSGSNHAAKANANILHNRDPIYNYHRKEKRRVRSFSIVLVKTRKSYGKYKSIQNRY